MKLTLNRFPIIHPFLFAIIPILFLYCRNIQQLPLHIIFLPMAVTISITLISLLILKRTKLSYNAAAVLVTFFWVWFFLYASVRNFIIEHNIFSFVGLAIDRHRYFMPIWVMILILFSIIIIRRKSSYENANNYFNVTSIVLVLLQIGIGVINYSSYNLHITGSKPSLDNLIPNQMMSRKESLPPVYYIVLDAYGGAPEMNEIMGFDNHDFINYLEKRGFYVARHSHSNYSDTAYCMSSTMNMQYLPMVDPLKSDSETVTLISGIPYLEMMNSNRVVNFLESLGYTYVNLSVFENQGFYFKNASFNSFNLELLKYSILGKLVIEDFVEGTLKREEILRQFKELENVPNLPGPTFVYAHILIPHEPYVFDRDGNEPSLVSRALLVAYKEKLYVDQLLFANKMTQKIIDKILAQSKKEPIIIVQGDHGPPAMGRTEEESRRLRMSILNAYYFPGGGGRRLYDSITPVNSFRIMLNYYFEQNLPLLVDDSFFSKTKNLPLLVDDSVFTKTIQTLIRMTPQLKGKNSEPKSK